MLVRCSVPRACLFLYVVVLCVGGVGGGVSEVLLCVGVASVGCVWWFIQSTI